MTTEPSPAITALICTRNRGASLVPTVSSILASEHTSFELLVIDQSTNDETANALAPTLSDPRLRYVRTPTQGLGVAHNIGLASARSEIIAITDDDCEVPSNWLTTMATPFQREPRVALVFCNVDAVEHDRSAGFIPAFHFARDVLLTSTRDGLGGIGAGFAIRRRAAI